MCSYRVKFDRDSLFFRKVGIFYCVDAHPDRYLDLIHLTALFLEPNYISR